jgi:Carboxypeptidase regulatory-like domain
MDTKCSPGRLVLVLWVIVLASAGAGAQTRPQSATLRVTVRDPSGAVIPGAAVQLTRVDDNAGGEPGAPVMSDGQGVAQAGGLAPGRYLLEVTFPGFEPHQSRTCVFAPVTTGRK